MPQRLQIDVLPIFEYRRRSPLGNCHLEQWDLPFETRPQTAGSVFGMNSGSLSQEPKITRRVGLR